MKKAIIIYTILLFSSCLKMKHQFPSISKQNLPDNCSGAHDFISENWYKHRKKRCHKDTFNAWKFSFDYKECMLKLTKKQVLMLFGNPDISTGYNEFVYILDEDCSDYSLRHYDLLNIKFERDSVIDVRGGGVSTIE
jgi:hypothetical protein